MLLVIAADEGIMPQTKEHLHICSLLGITQGLVALTKIDLVETDWLELVKSEITDFLPGLFSPGQRLIMAGTAARSGGHVCIWSTRLTTPSAR
ncbi:MAG: GTP-binding protein [Desulfomicrobium escambiense]|nr:GTP-binding protein [Desulfomicrobium escambiense]